MCPKTEVFGCLSVIEEPKKHFQKYQLTTLTKMFQKKLRKRMTNSERNLITIKKEILLKFS